MTEKWREMKEFVCVREIHEHGHGASDTYNVLCVAGGFCSLSKFKLQYLADKINSGAIKLPDDPPAGKEPTLEDRLEAAGSFEEKIWILIDNSFRRYKDEIRDRFRGMVECVTENDK